MHSHSSSQAITNLFCLCGFATFWTFHVSRIMQHVAFCVELLSLSIMFSQFIHVWRVSVLHSFFWLNTIPLYEHTTFYLSTCQLLASLGLLQF